MIESAMPFKEAFLELKVKDSNYTYCSSSQDLQRASMQVVKGIQESYRSGLWFNIPNVEPLLL
jgi:hypothetical protein